MTRQARSTADLVRWFESQTSSADYLDDVLFATAGTSQRPAWSFPSLWLPDAAPTWTRPRIVVLAALVGALALGVALVVGALLDLERRGPLTNGAIAYSMFTDPLTRIRDVYLVGPGDQPARRLGSADDGRERRCPTFSPDGSLLAFGERRVPDGVGATATWLVVIDPVDLSTRLRTSLGHQFGVPCPRWTPDGGRLAVLVAEAYGPEGHGCCADIEELWLVPIDGAPTVTAHTPSRIPGNLPPAWIHDGSAVALASSFSVRLEFVDGSIRRILAADTTSDPNEQFDWVSPSHIDPYLAIGGSWVKRTGSGGEAVAGFVRITDLAGHVVHEDNRGAAKAVWSSIGLVAWATGDRIVVLDPDGALEVELRAPWMTADGQIVRGGNALSWSADGQRLLFEAFTEDRSAELQYALVSIGVGVNRDLVVHTPWTPWLDLGLEDGPSWQALPR